MFPACLSLEESVRKEREKNRVFYAELGLSCEVHARPPTVPTVGGECSALRRGARCLASRGAPREGGRSSVV